MAEKKEIKIPSDKELEILIENLPRYFKKIKNILNEWIDIKEEDKTIISLWIIGTYLHKQFSSYPYLYFWAMKGGGKTRILNIIANLSKNGKLQAAITKAGIFRSKGTYCIDEFEGVGRKGNEDLKELLNGAYKRGSFITRYDDVKKKPEGEKFNLYRPIAMANIWGMDNVLADRCIKIVLEKSGKKEIINLWEDFENDTEFQVIRGGLSRNMENIGDDLNLFGNLKIEWKNYCQKKEFDKKYEELFSKISKSNIDGRYSELFSPLFIIADMIDSSSKNHKILDEVIESAKKIVKESKEQDREDNNDIKIYEFVAQLENKDFVAVSDLVKAFKEYFDFDDNDTWVNSRWFGRGLKRLNLVIDKRRLGKGIVIILDIEKAKEQIKLFREPDFKEELQEALK